MSNALSSTQVVRKTVIRTAGGLVASQHRRAAEAGAQVLAAGGDAVDAAVAVSFAAGVAEPWMSGPMGGGAMTLYRADQNRAQVVYFGMRSPAGLDPAHYPLAGTGAVSTDLFPWPAVVDDRNARGATAVAVPGTVAGMELAHATHGRLPWRELLQPAIALAREGLPVDWYTTLMIAGSARWLARDADAAQMFLDDGIWPKTGGWATAAGQRIMMARAADTLACLAEDGPRAFYEGDVGAQLARDVRDKGGCLTPQDLRDYRASIQEPLSIPYRGGRVYATPEMTAGPSLARCLQRLQTRLQPGQAPDAGAFLAYADVLREEYRWRLSNMGDNEDPRTPACTTHFSVVDRHGNQCAVTQTLLSAFGSHVVSPSTGMLLNNGIMWFDPEPGKANSLAPARRCLMNICPVIGEADGRRFALGASGGRKILPAVMQLVSFLVDYRMSLEDAFHHARLDASTDIVTLDPGLPVQAYQAVAAAYPHAQAPRTFYPYAYACPSAVLRDGGENQGCTEIMAPWGDVAPEPPRG